MVPWPWITAFIQLVYLINAEAECIISHEHLNYPLDLFRLYKTMRCEDNVNTHMLSENYDISALLITRSDLKTTELDSIRELRRLEWISITHSNISEITQDIFTDMDKLVVIDLSVNNISIIEPNSFSDLKNLHTLNLTRNSISLKENCFSLLGQLRFLNLAENQISHIPCGIFKDMHYLNLLNLSVNKINSWDPGSFAGLNSLQTIDLSSNEISLLSKDCLSDLNHLESLRLEKNQISHIQIGTFKEMHSLIFLNLSANKINSLKLGSFASLNLLKTLDLSSNEIFFFPSDVVFHLPRITSLFISNNYMKNINTEILIDYLPVLKRLSLDGNNWTCSILSNIIWNLRKKQIFIDFGRSTKIKNINGIACSGDIDIEGKMQISNEQDSEPDYEKFMSHVNLLNSKVDDLKDSVDAGGQNDAQNKLMIVLIFLILLLMWITSICKFVYVCNRKRNFNFSIFRRSRKEDENVGNQFL